MCFTILIGDLQITIMLINREHINDSYLPR